MAGELRTGYCVRPEPISAEMEICRRSLKSRPVSLVEN